jgi:hypothetical protein
MSIYRKVVNPPSPETVAVVRKPVPPPTPVTVATPVPTPTPMAAKLELAADVTPIGLGVSGVLPPLPPQVINERTLIFRMDSRTLWTRYALGMINFSVSDFGNLPSTNNVQNNLSRNAAAVGSYFIPYYGITAGTKISGLLDVLLKNGVKVVDAIKNNTTDTQVYTNIWAQETRSLAQYLNELNPSQYPTDLINEMLTNLTKFWVADFEARYAEDFAADAVALDNILKVAVSGIPDHANKGYSSIADILSRGIIAQFPLSFVE